MAAPHARRLLRGRDARGWRGAFPAPRRVWAGADRRRAERSLALPAGLARFVAAARGDSAAYAVHFWSMLRNAIATLVLASSHGSPERLHVPIGGRAEIERQVQGPFFDTAVSRLRRAHVVDRLVGRQRSLLLGAPPRARRRRGSVSLASVDARRLHAVFEHAPSEQALESYKFPESQCDAAFTSCADPFVP